MRFFKFNLILLSVFLLLNAPIFAQSGKTTEFMLSNGLKLLVIEDHRAPIAISQIWYKVGSSYEPNGITGISHLLEHMMFEGTNKYGQGKLNEMVVSNGGEINAMTSNDFTMYYEIVPKDKLPLIFSLEADRMQGLLINSAAYYKEKKVVLEERKLTTQDDPEARTYERFAAIAHISSPYRNPTIGWLSDIEDLFINDLYTWYKNWYNPNNAILVVAGDVVPNDVYQLTNKYFMNVPKKPVPMLKSQIDQESLGKRTVDVKMPAKLPWLVMGYNVPVLKTANPTWEAYALEVAAAVLDMGGSSRISRDIIRKQQIAIDASVSYPIYSRLDDLFVLEGVPAENRTILQLENAFLQQIRQLQDTLVSKDELERVKTQVVANKIYSLDSIEEQAAERGSLEVVGLPWKEADEYVANIKKITPEQVRYVAKKYLISDRLSTATLIPQQIKQMNPKVSDK